MIIFQALRHDPAHRLGPGDIRLTIGQQEEIEAAIQHAREEMIGAIERAGFYVSGPTDHRAAEDGEPAWVCRMREALRALGDTP